MWAGFLAMVPPGLQDGEALALSVPWSFRPSSSQSSWSE